MSVYTCSCGRRTTEPFVIRGARYCTICAEDIAPAIVTSRERRNLRKFGPHSEHSPGFERSSYDFGKHR